MKLKQSNEYYTKDQTIQSGELVAVWGIQFDENNIIFRKYDKYDSKMVNKHGMIGGDRWTHATRISDPIEIEEGDPAPDPVTPNNSFYGDIWVKAYSSAPTDNATVADAALSDYKTREAAGDFKK